MWGCEKRSACGGNEGVRGEVFFWRVTWGGLEKCADGFGEIFAVRWFLGGAMFGGDGGV